MGLALKLYKSNGVRVTAAVHRILLDANRARDTLDWAAAATGYREALARDPALVHIWIQYGHALKETNDLAEAETAYRRAVALRPELADAHLHVGHVRKRQGDSAGAARAYLAAVRLDPTNVDAVSELQRLAAYGVDITAEELLGLLEPVVGAGWPDSADAGLAAVKAALSRLEATLRRDTSAPELLVHLEQASGLVETIERAIRAQGAATVEGPPLVFDVSDLLAYFRDSRLPTGIQRVQIETIVQALATADSSRIRICGYLPHRDVWVEIPPSAFLALCQLSLGDSDRSAPAWLALLTRLQVLLNTAERLVFPAGAWLINLGTSWWVPNYFLSVRQARTEDGGRVRYVPFVHDFIPLRAPHCCAKALTQDFISWAINVFDHADLFLVNSESTKRDLLEVSATLGRPVADASVEVVRLDADARKPAGAAVARNLATWGLARTPYVLFVATIEARKNHVLAFDAWLDLMRRHGVKAAPKLVCVGKRGWLDKEIYAKLEAHADLRDRVMILSNLSDADLGALYGGCLFTLYPSTFEGWGLPVTESLCHGKVPLTSTGTSLPEAGGDFGVYFEAGSLPALTQALERLIFDAPFRADCEEKIAKGFKPRSWRQVAEQVIGAVTRAAAAAPVAQDRAAPPARLGAHHSFARTLETRIWAGRQSAERFRAGDGWWGQDDWGCWTKPDGGTLEIGLDAPHGPLRLYLQLHGLPSASTAAQIEIDGVAAPTSAELDVNGLRWVAVEVPASASPCPRHEVLVASDQSEDLAERTGGSDRRVVSVGVAGFFVCERDDAAARAAFSEAVSLGALRELAFDRERPGPAMAVGAPHPGSEASIDPSSPARQVVRA